MAVSVTNEVVDDADFSPQVHLNLNVRGMSRSATVAINERCAALIGEGREIVRLGLGQSPFPIPDVMVGALREHAAAKDYLAVKGLPELRRAIVEHYRRTQGLDYLPENVLIGPGTKELMFLVQLVYYGELVIPAPSWVSYAPQARIIGRNLHWLPTEIETGLGVTPEALEQLCAADPHRPRLLILNYPGNPTGTAYSDEQLRGIAAVARRYRVLLLADEIYSGLRFDGEHVSIARYYPEGTIVSNGLSKWAGAGGWRLGAFAFPATLTWLVDAMAAVASETFTSTSAPIQHAAVHGFVASPEWDDYLARARKVLRSLMLYSYDRLRSVGAELAKPKGGFYVFPNFSAPRTRLNERGIKSSRELCERALEELGLAFLPGSVFGRPEHELSARISCVDFDGSAALDAAGELGNGVEPDENFLHKYCNPTFDAINRLADWVAAS